MEQLQQLSNGVMTFSRIDWISFIGEGLIETKAN